MVVKAICSTEQLGFKENIANWGWTLLIVGGLIVTILGLTVLPQEVFKWTLISVAVISALGIYIFNTPGRNPLINIGAGLWDTYNVVTGILGDVLSYIRLYALGLAGGMLGAAFNNLGNMILGDGSNLILWIPFILILILGHTLNLGMSALGSFVHPLRLSFVEYFKNAGYEGKGTLYQPFKK
jgi:V/A-type H+-transporting ATPase subunit I